MRRRELLTTAPLGLLAAATVAACDGPGGPQEQGAGSDGGGAGQRGDSGPSATGERADGAGPPRPVADPTPRVLGDRAPVVDYRTLRLPLEMTPMIVVDPGWTAPPLELDGVFLGHREEAERVVFTAVAQDGTLLWEADRPLTCTGAALSRDADGAAVAVLPDLAAGAGGAGSGDGETGDDPGTRPATLSVTCYDLRTAERRWGPVDVPGPQAAAGLVYAAGPLPAPATDDGRDPEAPRGEAPALRRALDATSGDVLVEEGATGQGGDRTAGSGPRVLAEHLGTVLLLEGEEIVAVDAEGERWRRPLPAPLESSSAQVIGVIDPSTGYAVLATGDGAGDATGSGFVLEVGSGALVAEDALAVAQDHGLGVTVVASRSEVRGLDADGTERWRHTDPDAVHLLSAGERLAYGIRQREGTLIVLDTGEGRMVNPYDQDGSGPFAVPEVFSADAAVAVSTGQDRLLVTTEFDPEYGRRG